MTATPAPETTKDVRPFGIRDKIGYMFGDFGNDFTFMLAAFYLIVFYTDVFQVSPYIVGWLFLISRVVDAFTDVGMGILVDNMKPTKYGRFRPWILRGAVPVAVASVLLYMVPVSSWEESMKIIYMFVTYLLWGSVTYTMINIPYGSMASVISDDPSHRSSLSVFRTLGAQLAYLVMVMVPPLIIYRKNEAGKSVVVPENFFMLAVVLAGFAILFYFFCFKLVTERVVAPPKPKVKRQPGDPNPVVGLLTNRALWGIVAAALLLLLGSMLNGSMNNYLWKDYFNSPTLQSIAGFAALAPTFILMPFATKLGKKFGKREIGVVGMFFCGAMNILIYVLKLQPSPVLFIVLFAIAGLGLGIFNILIWAFITDVIDYQEVRTGTRNDGTIYAVYSWSRKLGQAAAGGLGGFALGWIAYDGKRQGGQTPETLNGIYMFATLVPGVFYILVGLALMFIYPLSKKAVESNVAFLQAKKEAESVS